MFTAAHFSDRYFLKTACGAYRVILALNGRSKPQRVKDLLKWLVNMHHGHLTEVIPEHYSWKFRENQIAIETFVIVLAFYKGNCSSITRYLYIFPQS